MALNSASGRPPRLHPAFSTRQGLALLEESISVRSLLRETIVAIGDTRYVDYEGDSIFTLGSIGVEQTNKVILGCNVLVDYSAWPTNSKLSGWGHDI